MLVCENTKRLKQIVIASRELGSKIGEKFIQPALETLIEVSNVYDEYYISEDLSEHELICLKLGINELLCTWPLKIGDIKQNILIGCFASPEVGIFEKNAFNKTKINFLQKQYPVIRIMSEDSFDMNKEFFKAEKGVYDVILPLNLTRFKLDYGNQASSISWSNDYRFHWESKLIDYLSKVLIFLTIDEIQDINDALSIASIEDIVSAKTGLEKDSQE